jgi:SepF-like predicted cell division protein (DUF552 family)
MAKKIASATESLFNKKVEPISEKWYTEEESNITDHQPVRGRIDNNPEEGNIKCCSASGVLDMSNKQKCDRENILVIDSDKVQKVVFDSVNDAEHSSLDNTDSRPELHETTTCAETNKNSASDTVPNGHLHSSRTSGRPKRPPVTRHDDFLWSTSATRTKQ